MPRRKMEQEYYPVSRVAELLQVSPATVRKWGRKRADGSRKLIIVAGLWVHKNDIKRLIHAMGLEAMEE